MNTYVNEIRAAWRWLHLFLYVRSLSVATSGPAVRSASYACSSLFHRALLGRPTERGPYQFAEAMLWHDLTVNQAAASDADHGRWLSSSMQLFPLEAERLCMALGQLHALNMACELGPVGRLTLDDSVLYYNPWLDQWLDGFTHTSELQLVTGTLHRIELAMDDPEAPAADWERLGREYADGELHRHLGWSQWPEAQEGEADGQQAAEVRGERLSDEARPDDQVEGERADREPVPGAGPRPGAHHADADHH